MDEVRLDLGPVVPSVQGSIKGKRVNRQLLASADESRAKEMCSGEVIVLVLLPSDTTPRYYST